MEFSPADSSHIDANNIDVPADSWWDFMIDHSDVTADLASLEPITTVPDYTPPSSDIQGPSSSLPLSHNRSTYQVTQSLVEFSTTFDTRTTPQPDQLSDAFDSLTSDSIYPYDLVGAIGTESTGHDVGRDGKPPPLQSYGISCGPKQQPQISSPVAETNECHSNHDNLLLSFDGSSSHSRRNLDTGDALAVNRAGCLTSDLSAEPSFYHRRAQQQNGIQMDEYKEALMEHSSGTFPVPRHEHQLGVHSASEPTSPHNTLPRTPSMAFASTISFTSASSTPSNDDSWECEKCGRVIATKGTKNRTRNKRRHHCPGTGPKYPCSACPKSFNRGDTRLLHLRRKHPETNTEPARPRNVKRLQ